MGVTNWYLVMSEMIILVMVGFISLSGKPWYQLVYGIGIIINWGINIILKRWLEQPRPNTNMAKFKMQLKDKATMNTDEFGMPSGHAQYSGFTLVYVLLVSHSLWAWASVMFGAIWVCGQRVISTDHSILQVSVGLFIGSVLAIIAYKLTMWFLKFKYPQMVLPKSWPFGSILYF